VRASSARSSSCVTSRNPIGSRSGSTIAINGCCYFPSLRQDREDCTIEIIEVKKTKEAPTEDRPYANVGRLRLVISFAQSHTNPRIPLQARFSGLAHAAAQIPKGGAPP
jgi:hypothetical protein